MEMDWYSGERGREDRTREGIGQDEFQETYSDFLPPPVGPLSFVLARKLPDVSAESQSAVRENQFPDTSDRESFNPEECRCQA